MDKKTLVLLRPAIQLSPNENKNNICLNVENLVTLKMVSYRREENFNLLGQLTRLSPQTFGFTVKKDTIGLSSAILNIIRQQHSLQETPKQSLPLAS